MIYLGMTLIIVGVCMVGAGIYVTGAASFGLHF